MQECKNHIQKVHKTEYKITKKTAKSYGYGDKLSDYITECK